MLDISDLKSLKTCFLSNFPPKECGIATFTKDLSTAMDKRFNPKLKSKVIALNSEDEVIDYEDKVILKVDKEDIESYINISKRINERDDIRIVCVQHEFGIFGGDYGCYLIPFLESLQKPAIVTFHTVLPNPDFMRRAVVKAIAQRVSAIIVTANAAIKILNEDYGIERSKIHVVHHGIPNVSFQKTDKYKCKLGFGNKTVLSTFGMLSRGKGIEYAIRALPGLVEKYPNLVYLIIGETHPGACYEDGEKYREELNSLVRELGLQRNVIFIKKYLSLDKIIEYLLATDIYLFTNLEKAQISSGTLAYAIGCGKAVVATPIIYAEELLGDERGVLARFKDPDSFRRSIDKLLSDPEYKSSVEKNAYFFSRQMIWSNVAYAYLKIFNKTVNLRKEITEKFPEIKLNHLKNLTDNIGVIQFAEHVEPDKKSGYTLDDNARALIAITLYNLISEKKERKLLKLYFNFIQSVQDRDGKFKNQHLNKEERTNPYSEDAFGRALWSLGYLISKSRDISLIQKAKKILEKSLGQVDSLDSSRSKAFSLTGLVYYYQRFPEKDVLRKINLLADFLVNLYKKNSSKEWFWFEDYLTYDNAQLCNSLFLAYSATGNRDYLNIAESSLKFLSDLCIIKGKLHPIGQNGWYNRRDRRAFFDQQPIDSSTMVQTYLTAYEITKKEDYYDKAVIAFNWFLGHNHLNQMIYDEITGGCFDGLGKHSLNFNQGAESTISYLIARMFMEEFKRRE
jgi:glycosyltransferase involved in cell wall biosynthesis